MIEVNHRRGLAGSSSSSEAVNSAQNTPETKLTTFSPEEIRSGYKAPKNGIVRPNIPPAFALNVQAKASASGKASNVSGVGFTDPFVTSSTAAGTARGLSDGPKLSPIASSFTPLGSQLSLFGSSSRQSFNLPASASMHSIGSSNADLAGVTSSTAAFPGNLGQVDARSAASADVTPRQSQHSLAASPKKYPKLGQFSSDINTSRYLYVARISSKTTMMEIEQFFHRDIFPSLKHLGTMELILTGSIYVSFGDIREAIKAYTKVQQLCPDWTVDFIATSKYFKKQNIPLPAIVYEAQAIVIADYSGPIEQFSSNGIGVVIKELLENYGEIMAMEALEDTPPRASYRVEFHNTISLVSVMQAVKGFKIAACTLSIEPYSDGNNDPPLQFADMHRPLIIGQDDAGMGNAFNSMSLSSPAGGYGQDVMISPSVQGAYGYGMMNTALWAPYPMQQPPAGRSFACHRDLSTHQMPSPLDLQKGSFSGPDSGESSPWSPFFSPYPEFGMQSPLWSPYTPGAIGQERGTPLLSPYRSGYYPYQQRLPPKLMGRQSEYPSGHHNVVDVERIRQGLDVRTTIMLRNIPNKIDQAMLKDIVDETSRGKYDFMYLRIDFANNCNVGYAFINFEDPYYIIDFMNARAGSRWNRFNSDKVAEVSYATIQGRDCLVQKFRNSSVMLEHPSFRPKIFHTTGPMAGTEDIFPGPDNPSKMRRSVENAEHVGLFAPRAGQNFRDEQRRRRSQYDRGTRLAEMEDAYDIDRHDYRGDMVPYYPSPALRYRRSSPYLPVFEEY